MKRISFPMMCVILLPLLWASADEILIEPNRDAFVCDCDPGATNPFAGNQFLAQGRISSCFHRTYISWDLSDIPAGSTIESAEFRIYCAQRDGAASGDMLYFRVTEDWNENTVTFGNRPSHTEEGVVILSDWPVANSWHSVDVTDFTLDWFSGETDNYGLYCHSQYCTGMNDCLFYSSRVSVPAYRPKLVVNYTTSASLDPVTWGEVKGIE